MVNCTYAQTHQYSACETTGAVVSVCEGRHPPHGDCNAALKIKQQVKEEKERLEYLIKIDK